MHSWICSLWSTRTFDGLHFYLALAREALIGVVGEADSPLNVSWCDQHSWYMPIVLFIFTWSVVQHLGILGKTLKYALWSWGFKFDCFVSNIFGGRSKLIWGTRWRFQHDLVWSFRPELPGGLQYCRRLLILLTNMYLRRSCGLFIVSWLPAERNSKVFRGTASWLRVMYRKVFSLSSNTLTPWKRRSRGVVFPYASVWQDLPSFLF